MPVSRLPDVRLSKRGTVTADFLAHGITRFRAAGVYVRDLPFRRTRRAGDFRSVLTEGCGTCSSKHALLAALAREQSLSVKLRLGIFEMTAENTPAIGDVLVEHGLDAIPEAHCTLDVDGERVDLTTARTSAFEPDMMHEETIAPLQVGTYKETRHREFMDAWLQRHHAEGRHTELDLDALWEIREACIARMASGQRSS